MRLVALHYHIFKNAGTTIENILDQSFGERFLALDVPGLNTPVTDSDLLDRLDRRPELMAVSSHQIRHPVPRAQGFLFFDICFLRDPLERLRSTYDYYRLKPDPADPLSELAVRSTLRDFAAAMIRDSPLYVKNVQVNLLACGGNSDEPEENDLLVAARRFVESSFPGVVDLFDESVVAGEYALRRVFPELDCAIRAANVSRGFEGGVADRAAGMRHACGDEIYGELVRLNQLDFRLVEVARAEVRRRFQAVPGREARLSKLAARRRGSPAEAHPVAGPRRIAARPAPAAGIGTLVRRAVRLAPYVRVLRSARPLIFDAEYYRRLCPNAGRGRLRPWIHFLLRGGFAGLAPHPLFDPAFYLARYPDVAKAGINPLAHYLKHGGREGRQPHPLFDPIYYLDHSPDVRSAGQNPLVHYVLHGAREGRRPHPLFDPEHYRKSAGLTPKFEGNLLVDFLARGADAPSPHAMFDCEAWLAARGGSGGDANPLLAYLDRHPAGAPAPLGFFNSSGDLDWIAEAQQRPFLKALRPDQLLAQLHLEGGF